MPTLLCCTGRQLVVSVFKHPLKPKKIGRELRSALKEVSPPAVPCYMQRCWDEQPLNLGCNQHPMSRMTNASKSAI